MVVPQKPYIPIATLRAAVTYPSEPDAYGDDAIRKALSDARLGGLIDQLDREDVWSQRLSGGEQQRIALARALLMRPDWLFLDESTAALDEKLEAEMYTAGGREGRGRVGQSQRYRLEHFSIRLTLPVSLPSPDLIGGLTGQSSIPGLWLLDRPVKPGDDSTKVEEDRHEQIRGRAAFQTAGMGR